MTKKDLIEKLAVKFEDTKIKSKMIVDFIFDEVFETLAREEEVLFRGFKVKTKELAPINRLNTLTGKNMKLPVRKTLKVKIGKELKEALNTKPAKKGKK